MFFYFLICFSFRLIDNFEVYLLLQLLSSLNISRMIYALNHFTWTTTLRHICFKPKFANNSKLKLYMEKFNFLLYDRITILSVILCILKSITFIHFLTLSMVYARIYQYVLLESSSYSLHQELRLHFAKMSRKQ